MKLKNKSLEKLEETALKFLDSGEWEVSKPIRVYAPFFGRPGFSCELKKKETR